MHPKFYFSQDCFRTKIEGVTPFPCDQEQCGIAPKLCSFANIQRRPWGGALGPNPVTIRLPREIAVVHAHYTIEVVRARAAVTCGNPLQAAFTTYTARTDSIPCDSGRQ